LRFAFIANPEPNKCYQTVAGSVSTVIFAPSKIWPGRVVTKQVQKFEFRKIQNKIK